MKIFLVGVCFRDAAMRRVASELFDRADEMRLCVLKGST